MTPLMGPSRERLLELLEGEDAEAQLPITLAFHEPKAKVMREGDKWVIRKLVHDPQATVAAARKAKAEGREFRPEDAWALMQPGPTLVAARTKAELIAAVKKMKWVYGNGTA